MLTDGLRSCFARPEHCVLLIIIKDIMGKRLQYLESFCKPMPSFLSHQEVETLRLQIKAFAVLCMRYTAQ